MEMLGRVVCLRPPLNLSKKPCLKMQSSQFLTTIENVRPLFASEAGKIKRLPAEEKKLMDQNV
jgi:hypothetical protein